MPTPKCFYVGTAAICTGDLDLLTYQQAVNKATEHITSGDRTVAHIVKVVAVVRRKEAPVIVEKFQET